MRLFVAIDFDATTKRAIMAVQDELRSVATGGTFTLADNLHLTLAFLGECDARSRDAAERAMDDQAFAPFDIAFDRTGRFRAQGGDIWWLGLAASRDLARLQSGLVKALGAADVPVDQRIFRPHLTLGRRVLTTAGPWPVTPITTRVDRVVLMDSSRPGGRLTYTPIYTRDATK